MVMVTRHLGGQWSDGVSDHDDWPETAMVKVTAWRQSSFPPPLYESDWIIVDSGEHIVYNLLKIYFQHV